MNTQCISSISEGAISPSSSGMFGIADSEPYHYNQQGITPFYSTLPCKKRQYFAYDVPPERSITPDITRGLDKSQQSHQDSLYHQEDYSELRISPIDPRSSGGFKASTPSGKVTGVNLVNTLLSPKRTTMSNDELYAVIHKTKKKLNIGDVQLDQPEIARNESAKTKPIIETGYIGSQSSLSSENNKSDLTAVNKDSKVQETCNDRKGVKKMSTLDFKKLLLQKSSGQPSNRKMSAVEQLKLSKQQLGKQSKDGEPEQPANNSMTILDLSASPRSLVHRKTYNLPGSPERGGGKPALKVLSPRSQWRFANPRTDVLSSTIIEDCREDDINNSNGAKSLLEKRVLLNRQEDCKPDDNVYSSVSEKISAQRAKFFEAKTPNNKKLPPTLETSF